MRYVTWIVAGAVFLFFLLIRTASHFYIDWLWFDNLGLAPVFITALTSFWGIRLVAWLFFSVFLYANLLLTQKTLLEMPNLVLRQILMNTAAGNLLTKSRLRKLFFLIALFVPWLFTGYVGNAWLQVRLYLAGGQMGVSDPVFLRDVGFYLFSLPFLGMLYEYLMMVLITTIILSGLIYIFVNPPEQLGLRGLFARRGQAHLSVLLSLAFAARAFGYILQSYQLLFSTRGTTFGAGYTDIAAQLPALRILTVLSLVAAAALIVNTRVRKSRLITGSVVALILASILLNGVWPGLIQKFVVEPNEYSREERFLRYNIDMTIMAYGLDRIQQREFPLTGALGYEELRANEGTVNNIRLWDWQPLKKTFAQLQERRPYYRFHDVDTDRYWIDGEYRQVMLSARELVTAQLPAKTWVNDRLIYTHGYGVVVAPVNEVTGQGMPRLMVRDFPVQSEVDLSVTVPQIYYGELSQEYVFTGTMTEEFDYPLGTANAFARYTGKGDLALGGWLRRLLLALRFSDYRILISSELQPESKVLFYREIGERVKKVAPFLTYDRDPYLVIDDGRLFWIIDAYTTSANFPYSQPLGNINYIRNSVKVVVDAYSGAMDYYIFEPDDLLIQAYAKIFPDLFKPADSMPAGLRSHIRYPEQLFKIQSQVYSTYHMQNTQVFFSKEDKWEWPQEIYDGKAQVMEPYYTILHLPGKDIPEFVLMLPYTPANRDNMVAWLAGRSDGDSYGELILYQFPKEELLYGPSQIEARIDQDSRISEQLSLWDQRGSSVIRGNLLVLPMEGSVLYVEPIYLQAEQAQMPELARVIVVYGERVVMERTLEEALASVFGVSLGTDPEPAVPSPTLPGDDTTSGQLINRAAELFRQAEQAMRLGDWAEYGRLQQQLGSVLIQLEQMQ